MTQIAKIIKPKLGLSELAKHSGNVQNEGRLCCDRLMTSNIHFFIT